MNKELKILSEISGYSVNELNERLTEPIIQPYDCVMTMLETINKRIRFNNEAINDIVIELQNKKIISVKDIYKSADTIRYLKEMNATLRMLKIDE
jgi:predicted HTH domain antitoxin